MNNLVIDLTHGGIKIAISLAKKGKNVIAYDIYNTLNNIDKQMLQIYGINLIQLKDLSNFKGDMNVIYPIHMPLTFKEIKTYNNKLNYTFQSHHEIIGEILNEFASELKKIEITGVKGKTTSVFMLKEILIDENPLILSSLGAFLYKNHEKITLKKKISITPANIKETIDLAYKLSNPNCNVENKLKEYNSCIFESSLGVTGIGDVGLLLNIVEDYPIAQRRKTASQAKKQVFKCECVCIEKETLDKYYNGIKHPKINCFSLYDSESNLFLKNIDYNLDETKLEIIYKNVKTINNNVKSGKILIETYAPGKQYTNNVLGVVLTCICLEINNEKIINGLKNFKGLPGRSNKKTIKNSIIIEDINSGLNTMAIKESINMINDLENYYISIGGDYGITCEEIDENSLSTYLNTLNHDIILTGDVGKSLSKKIDINFKYIENYNEIYKLAVNDNKNLLFIYRSDYNKVL